MIPELLNRPRRFFLVLHRVDFRKGHSGLLGEAWGLGLEPYAGDLVVFVSRDKTRIKILTGDDTGLTLLYKCFSKGSIRTDIRFLDYPDIRDVTWAEVAMLLEGSSYTVHKSSQKWLPEFLK